MSGHIAYSSASRSDPWDRELYDQWVARLGAERMRGFLSKLREQFEALRMALLKPGPQRRDDVHRRAHDVASTGGMLGFTEVTCCCRAGLEAASDVIEADAWRSLAEALERAISRLDRYFAAIAFEAVAA